MRSSLQQVFSHESTTKSLEETKQYGFLLQYYIAIMVFFVYSIIEGYMKKLDTE